MLPVMVVSKIANNLLRTCLVLLALEILEFGTFFKAGVTEIVEFFVKKEGSLHYYTGQDEEA